MTFRKTTKVIRRALSIALATTLIVAVLAPALSGAQTPAESQYRHLPVCTNCGAQSGGGGGQLGPLPFTGFDVLSMAGVALGVTGLGLVLQRAVSRQPREDV